MHPESYPPRPLSAQGPQKVRGGVYDSVGSPAQAGQPGPELRAGIFPLSSGLAWPGLAQPYDLLHLPKVSSAFGTHTRQFSGALRAPDYFICLCFPNALRTQKPQNPRRASRAGMLHIPKVFQAYMSMFFQTSLKTV